MAANAGETKVKLWEGICYPENMRDDWQDEIDDILQVPFAYAVHELWTLPAVCFGKKETRPPLRRAGGFTMVAG